MRTYIIPFHTPIRQKTKRYHQMFVIIAAISNLVIITVIAMLDSNLHFWYGSQTRVWVPVDKIFLGSSKGRTG
jgi:hypothetical protein